LELQANDYFKAFVPHWPDVPTQIWQTRERALEEVAKAAEAYLEDRLSRGLGVPAPRPFTSAGQTTQPVEISLRPGRSLNLI
jgi:predicted RNase H-like HicB family nuclease